MRLMHVLAATAAALTLGMSVANAETVTSGQVDVHYAWIDSDAGDADVYGLSGSVAAPLGGNWGIQGDLGWNTVDDDASGGDDDAIDATVHVFSRNDATLLGGALGVVDSDNSTSWGGALEGEMYFANSTAGGRIVYLTNDDADVDFWGLDAHYRYFATDDLKLEIGAGWGQADGNGGGDADVLSVGAEAEYQLAAAPVSLFAAVDYANVDYNGGSSGDGTAVLVGARWNFGGSLKERDRTGASLKALNSAAGGLAGVF